MPFDPPTPPPSLGPPVDVARLGRAAALCAAGRDDLLRQGHAPAGERRLRSFSLGEVARHALGVPAADLRATLAARPDLPQGDREGGARRFTLAEVHALRVALVGPSGRPEGAAPKVVAVANFKGGSGKTTTAAHLAMAAALDGHRVLVIDLDSQASMTALLGGRVEDEWATAYPLIARDFALAVQAAGAGPLDEALTAALEVSPRNLVQPTHWPGIDLIGGQLNLYWAEFQVPVWRMRLRSWSLWDALTRALAGGLSEPYDVVILDTPPALGYLTINGLAAADILLIPLGASYLEFDSTGRFLDMLHATFASIEEGENAGRGAEGLAPIRFEWDAVRAVITRHEGAQQAALADLIEAYMGDLMARGRQDRTALVGQAGERASAIYEVDPRDFNRDTYARGRATFDATWDEVRDLLGASWRRDLEEAADGAA